MQPTDRASHATNPSPSLSTASRLLHAWSALLLALVAVVTLAAIIAWSISLREPSWWAPPDPTDPVTIAQAESIEAFITDELTKTREGAAPWRIAIPEDAAAAWLAVRLPRWLANNEIDWPIADAPLTLRIRNDGLLIAARPGADADRIFGARLSIEIDQAGTLRVRSDSVLLGSLAVPTPIARSALLDALSHWSDDAEAIEAIEALLRDGLTFDPASWPIDDSRRVEIANISFEDGRTVITCITRLGASTS